MAALARRSEPPILKLPYRGAPQTVGVITHAALKSQKHYPTRLLIEQVCSGIRSKDWISEYLAWHNFISARARYMRDPRTIELVKAPYVVVEEMLSGGKPSIDCLPKGTLLLNEHFEFVPIEELSVGEKIWGHDRWSTVERVWYKGILPQSAIFLNNGSSFCATADHHVYALLCPHDESEAPCSHCPPEGRAVSRIRVADLEVGRPLLCPSRISSGTETMDPRRALIEGYYLSDGWAQRTSFCISGQDGCPKEQQKREVEAICAELGVPTKWYRKFLHVKDKEWTLRLQQMGCHAPEKHALSINLEEGAAGALLRGIMADSGKNSSGAGRTLTTTSRKLFLQSRILHKMFGISCSERYIVNHGGFGSHPIWRLGIRQPGEKRREKVLRVKRIERNMAEGPVYDLTTDDHFVYLPEADVTVSNCDDWTALELAGLLLMGADCRAVIVAFQHMFYKGERQYSHVFAQAKEPRTGKWITLDPVAGPNTAEMLQRVVAARAYPI